MKILSEQPQTMWCTAKRSMQVNLVSEKNINTHTHNSLGPRLSPLRMRNFYVWPLDPKKRKIGESLVYFITWVTSKVERTGLRVGGQTRKRTVAHAFVQSPVTRRCTATYILLACRKAIFITYSCLHRGLVEYIYDLCVQTYIVRGAYSTLSVYAYSTYDTWQYPPHYYPAAAQSPSLWTRAGSQTRGRNYK